MRLRRRLRSWRRRNLWILILLRPQFLFQSRRKLDKSSLWLPHQDPHVRPLAEQDSETLQRLLPEIPLWVKNPDYDRVDWLNKLIAYMWPYLDKAICKTVKDAATPIIAEQIPKYKIDSVEFESLTLGTLPSTFQGMKVYVTDEKELMMEPHLKWAANPNILVTVKSFGLKATAQVARFLLLFFLLSPYVSFSPMLMPVFFIYSSFYLLIYLHALYLTQSSSRFLPLYAFRVIKFVKVKKHAC